MEESLNQGGRFITHRNKSNQRELDYVASLDEAAARSWVTLIRSPIKDWKLEVA
jgi:hypothetical protein